MKLFGSGLTKEIEEALNNLYDAVIKSVEDEGKKCSPTHAVGITFNGLQHLRDELPRVEDEFDRSALLGLVNLVWSLYKGADKISRDRNVNPGEYEPFLSEALRQKKRYFVGLFQRLDELYENASSSELISRLNEYLKR